MIEEIFTVRLNEWVKNSNLPQEEVACRAEITLQKLDKMLNGKLFPRAKTLLMPGNALNVSTDYLLSRTDNPKGFKTVRLCLKADRCSHYIRERVNGKL